MEIWIFLAALIAISLVNLWFITLITRSMRASIVAGVESLAKAQGEAQAAALAGVKDQIYQDLAGFFQAEPGQESEFGKVVAGMGAVIADQIFTKLKMAAIGKAGGQAERTKKDAGGSPIMGLLMNYLAGGSAGGLSNLIGAGQGAMDLNPGNNHSNQPASKLGF